MNCCRSTNYLEFFFNNLFLIQTSNILAKVFFGPKLTGQLMVTMRMAQEKFRSRQFFEGKTTPLVFHHIQISQQSVGTGIGSDILRVTRNLFSQAEKKISLGRPLSSFEGLPMVRGQLVIKNLPLNGPSFSGQNQNPKVLFELNVGQGKFGIKNPLKIVVVDGAKVHAQIY